tara:strand:- start:249 stop:1214 length:966 start_codon:yes stop_codon:yes gene_type:complete
MKIKFIKDNEFFSKELSILPSYLMPNEGVCIAGGFALYLYVKYNFCKKDYCVNNSDDIFSRFSFGNYSDIDFFRINNLSDKSIRNILFKELCDDQFPVVKYKDWVLSKDRHSRHANTFSLTSKKNFYEFSKIQGIKYTYKSIEDMFSHFDLHNCQIAIYENSFVFTDDFERTLNAKEVSLYNPDYFGRDKKIDSLIFQSNRAMKYANRLNKFFPNYGPDKIGLESKSTFCKSLSEEIMRVFIESEKYEPEYWYKDNFIHSSYYSTSNIESKLFMQYKEFSLNSKSFFDAISHNQGRISFLVNSNNSTIKSNAIKYLTEKEV